jgi:hypothetical protein
MTSDTVSIYHDWLRTNETWCEGCGNPIIVRRVRSTGEEVALHPWPDDQGRWRIDTDQNVYMTDDGGPSYRQHRCNRQGRRLTNGGHDVDE